MGLTNGRAQGGGWEGKRTFGQKSTHNLELKNEQKENQTGLENGRRRQEKEGGPRKSLFSAKRGENDVGKHTKYKKAKNRNRDSNGKKKQVLGRKNRGGEGNGSRGGYGETVALSAQKEGEFGGQSGIRNREPLKITVLPSRKGRTPD